MRETGPRLIWKTVTTGTTTAGEKILNNSPEEPSPMKVSGEHVFFIGEVRAKNYSDLKGKFFTFSPPIRFGGTIRIDRYSRRNDSYRS